MGTTLEISRRKLPAPQLAGEQVKEELKEDAQVGVRKLARVCPPHLL